MAWSPFSRPSPVVIPLACSDGQASVTFTPWGAAEQLAYQDGSSVFVQPAEDGRPREVRSGSLVLFAVTLIATAAEGFPPMPSGEAFDPSRADHLRELDAVTYDEIAEHALKVQPLPGAKKSDDGEATKIPADPFESRGPDNGPSLRPSEAPPFVVEAGVESDPSRELSTPQA